MTLVKTLSGATVAAMLTAGAAFAQSSALDVEPFDAFPGMAPSTMALFADEEGNVRSEDDFRQRMASASDTDREGVRNACSQMQQDEALISDRVSSLCKVFMDNL